MPFDAAGNGFYDQPVWNITYDNTAPVIPVVDASKSFNAAFNASIQQGVPSDANFKEFRFTTNGTNPTCATGTASSSQPTSVAIPATTTTLKVIACDLAGLSSPVSTSVYTFDNTAPSVTITSSTASNTNVSPIPITITFIESVTGFVDADVTVTNGTKSGFSGSGSTYTLNVTPTAQGAVTVNVAANVAQDAAGNNNTAAAQLSRNFDSVAPTVTITSNPPSGPTNNPSILLTFTFSEPVTGFTASDLSPPDATVGTFTATSSSVYTVAIQVDNAFEGVVSMILQASAAIDSAGNGNITSAVWSATYDPIAPTVTISSSAAPTTNVSPIPVTITFSESVTGFVDADVTVTNGTKSGFTGSGSSYTLSVTPSGQGVVTVNVAANVAQDAAGNNNTAATQLSRTFDSVAPTVTISSTTAATTSVSPIPVTITFSESVTGFVDADVTVTNGTKSGFSGSGTTYTVNVTPTAQGAVTVNVAVNVAQDAAGNGNTAAATLSRTFDSAAPTLSALSIQAISPSSTNFTPTVAFTLSEAATVTLYSDAGCGAAISAATSKASGSQSMVTNTLPDSAVTSIYIKGVDATGNSSSCALVGSYTTQLPAVTLSTPSRAVGQLGHTWTTATGATYNLYWATATGVTTSSSALTNVSQTYWHAGLTGGTTYYYKIAAVKNGVVGALSNEVSGVPFIGTVANPSISPAAGTYNRRQTITMSSATVGATIRFTTDGSAPNCSTSSIYSASFRIHTTQTVRAIGCLTNYADSNTTDSAFTMNIRTQVISFAPNSGHYIEVSNVAGGANIPIEVDIQAVGGDQIHHRWVNNMFGVCQWNGSSCYTWEYLWNGTTDVSANLWCNGTSSAPNYNFCRDSGNIVRSNGQSARFAFGSRLDMSLSYYGHPALFRSTAGAGITATVYVGNTSGQVNVAKSSWNDYNDTTVGAVTYTLP
jgi:hypothetical protein